MKKITTLLFSLLLVFGLAATAQSGFLKKGPSSGPSDVPPASACSGGPQFVGVEVGPQEIWAPHDKDVDIYISGQVSVDPDCAVTAEYSFESNSGLVTGSLDLAEDGSFNQTVPVNVSRSGQDKDGRTYSGILTATDEDGNTINQGFTVTVAHDRGQNTAQN